MYNQEGDPSEPEWVKTEREQFTEFRDKNKDGRMDKEETRDWILPSDYDHAEAEAKHLVYESDADKVCVCVYVRACVCMLTFASVCFALPAFSHYSQSSTQKLNS